MKQSDHPLRLWRVANGLKLADLTAKVGVSASHLSEIENGNNTPSLDLAARLSKATGYEVTVQEIAEASSARESAQ